MTTITDHGIPVPEETDPLGATDERIVELAEWLDDHLFRPAVYPHVAAVDDLVDLGFELDPAGTYYFNVVDAQIATAGLHTQLHLQLVYSGAAARNVPATGVLSPALPVFARIGNPAWRPLFDVGGISDLSSRVSTFVLEASGVIQLAALAPTHQIIPGEQFNTTFTYVRAGD